MDKMLLGFKADYDLLMDELSQNLMERDLVNQKHILDQDEYDIKRLDKKYNELITRINMNPYIHKENENYVFKEVERKDIFDF